MFETATCLTDVIGMESGLVALCRRLDPESVPLMDASSMVSSLAHMEKVIAGAKVRMAGRAHDSGQWKRDGHRSFADWLARETGTSSGAARATAETSKRLADQPATDEALRKGEVSESQANTISDAVSANPAAERDLVGKAKTSDRRSLRDAAGRAKAAADTDPEATRRRQHRARSCRSWTDSEGLWNAQIRNVAEIGAELMAILEPFTDRVFNQRRIAGDRETLEAYAADAVTNLFRTAAGRAGPAAGDGPTTAASPVARAAHAATGHDRASATSNEPSAATADAGSAGAGSAGARGTAGVGRGSDPAEYHRADPVAVRGTTGRRPDSKVIAYLDWEALRRGRREGTELCEISGVGPVPVSTVKAMLGDATLALVVRDGVDVRHVTHLGRQVTAHQRTALEARGYECAVPGCGSTHRLEIDHVTGWAVNHQTRLDDLGWLCHHHHDQKTHRRYQLTGPPGRRRWHHPNGTTDEPTTDEPTTDEPEPLRPPPARAAGPPRPPPNKGKQTELFTAPAVA